MKRLVYPLLGMLLLAAPCFPFAGQEVFDVWQDQYVVRGTDGKLLDVPYVATEYRIVDEMFKLLEIRSGDVLYDLGCGDGRIVIEAVKKTGVRGVGIDIDPRRIAESKANAIAAKVSDRVVFLQKDLFETDIREATVVTLFLFTEINLKLRPKLFQELKPGTRIVSHNFDMRSWKPDKEVNLGLSIDGFHNLYFWILPANASGLWQGRHNGEPWTLLVNQRFQKIEGSLIINGKTVLPLSETVITGDVIRFVAKGEREGRSIAFEGKIKDNVMEGIFRETGAAEDPWKATRDPATVSWIE